MEEVFNACYTLFQFIYVSGSLLWNWLNTPLVETEDTLGMLDFLAGETPLTLMFGSVLLVILFYRVIKFMLPF